MFRTWSTGDFAGRLGWAKVTPDAAWDRIVRARLLVKGLVQGVGFRPFVSRLACSHGLAGYVLNSSAGVVCEVEGPKEAIEAFCLAVRDDAPAPAEVSCVTVTAVDTLGSARFDIVESKSEPGCTIPPPDIAMCDACRRDLYDPSNRRFGHPFVSCAACGPRFTIVQSMPYDRPRTSMAKFPLCPKCGKEYADPFDRRFHAQTIACPACGPKLYWSDGNSTTTNGALEAARAALRAGNIVAAKGNGGYHLACDAMDSHAVAMLRARKGRSDKPFAVMVRDLDTAAGLLDMTDEVRAALLDRSGSIVVTNLRSESQLSLAPEVTCCFRELGVMLPYSPLHELLLARDVENGHPSVLVMTSGNRSGESIVIDDAEARESLRPLVDGWLFHDRPIVVPCDDSVVRVTKSGTIPIRRSRGLAPMAMALSSSIDDTLIAMGGDIKTCVCLAHDGQAWLSAHIGDLERVSTTQALGRVVQHIETLLEVRATRLVVDMHPGYRTVDWAERNAGGRPIDRVQHHHAHLASLLTEHGRPADEHVIGLVFDGAGYGTDGQIWGGEVLLGGIASVRRVASLEPVWQPGGDIAVRNPYRMALSHLYAAQVPWGESLPPVVACSSKSELDIIRTQVSTGLLSYRTSSMGRLFDAVSSICGVCQTADYEAEAAMLFENIAASAGNVTEAGYRFGMSVRDGLLVAEPGDVIREVVDDVRRGTDVATIGARFHQAVIDLILRWAMKISEQSGVTTVGLSGGVFLNGLLTELAVHRLESSGFTVLRHRFVPPSDAGLALGQVAVVHAQEGHGSSLTS
jgi:hydrogenase maturation protein HypF